MQACERAMGKPHPLAHQVKTQPRFLLNSDGTARSGSECSQRPSLLVNRWPGGALPVAKVKFEKQQQFRE